MIRAWCGGRSFRRLSLVARCVVLASCSTPTDWVVYVSSNASQSVIVRVTYDGVVRQVLFEPHVEGQIVALDRQPSSAHVSIIDPTTCTDLDAQRLPTVRALVSFGDAPGSNEIVLSVSSRSAGRGPTLMPDTALCVTP